MPDRWTSAVYLTALILFLFLLPLSACAGSGEADLSSITRDAERVSPGVLLHRAQTELEDPVRNSLRSEAELREFLEDALPQEAGRFADSVNFASSFVAIAAMGARPTGGFNVAIPEAYVRRDSMFVVVRHTIPGKDCMVPQVQTSPMEAVTLPKIAETVRFVVDERTLNCE